MSKSVFIYTYGCQMNVHDSEKMAGILSEKGYARSEAPEDADIIIFNTCAIRAKAEQKFYSQLGRVKFMKKKRPGLKIAVAGCIAQDSKGKLFRRAPYVDFALGPQNIHLINDLVSEKIPKSAFQNNPGISVQAYDMKRDSSIKAWVSIMYGCNNFCTYCIVPYTRGREVSRPSSSIVSEIKDLRDKGYKEATLLGQNVNSYRSDVDFAGLLRRIDDLGLHRLRFVTSHPRDLSLDLIKTMSELPSICEHIHLPLQSGSDKILRLMNRGYGYSEYLEKIKTLKEHIPDIAISTDIITGFPGEDENDYHLTVKALNEIKFDGIFAFKFSPREGTRACEMQDQVPEEIKTSRLNHILRIQEDITYRKNKLLEGTIQEILIEGPAETDSTMMTGRTRTNKIVTIPSVPGSEGSLAQVEIITAHRHSLTAIRINSGHALVSR